MNKLWRENKEYWKESVYCIEGKNQNKFALSSNSIKTQLTLGEENIILKSKYSGDINYNS